MAGGLRERKKAETRRALSSAALRLADRHGPDHVTVEAIAEAAGVSPRTFFNYFASKEDALVGMAPARASTLVTLLEERPAHEPPFEALRAAITEGAEIFASGTADWAVRQRLFQHHPTLAGRHAARFAEVEHEMAEIVARRAGLDVDRDPYPAIVVGATLAALRAALASWQARDPQPPVHEVLDEAFDHLAGGLALRTPAATGS
jgi:AcrR family transcriptional regulator